MHEPARVVVLLSGNGSNFQAMAEYAASGAAFDVVGVVSDQVSAYGLDRARRRNIAALTCQRAHNNRTEHERALTAQLATLKPDLLVLAGYMRILSPEFVRAWHGRMVNVHPSLLPKYRGLDTYARAIAAGEAWHGASVHFVTEQLDGGPVIAQERVAIKRSDTEETLRAKVQDIEYRIYPRVIDALGRGDLRLHEDQVLWQNRPLTTALTLDQLTREHT